ncbi:hypothetical protein NM208_g8653 [Fusarium decemcellulare]|uniref:Uncharacterized protein n=1 Tax=Fusarium decemcellulare TaxID=57161 RepID=A0ACC1S4J8_9HYPO|nr:hypothetical protein NM208_g8653 [Fusarium decemcellulare]
MASKEDIQEATAGPRTPLKADIAESTNAQPQEEDAAKTRRSRFSPKAHAWGILLMHLGACVAIALSITLAVHGYEALDDASATHASYEGGKLILRVGDVTTIISAALVVVRLLVGSWTTLAVWACGHFMLSNASSPSGPDNKAATIQTKEVRWMMRWKLPPWLRAPFSLPASRRQWAISLALVMVTVQTFISPVLTGAVNWTSTPVSAPDVIVPVAAVDHRADFGNWKWFNYPYKTAIARKPYLRTAAGYASMVWSDLSSLSPNGSSLTGNGCRHVVSGQDSLGRNATLLNAVIPCIQIHSIDWYKAGDEVSRAEWVYVADSSSLSLMDDPPSNYYNDGVTVVFDTVVGWNKSQDWDHKPDPIVFSKKQTIGMMVKRVAKQTPACSALDPTIFGSVDHLGRYLLEWGDATNKNCYFIGTVNFTAGVTVSTQSKYISDRVVEDQTPLGEVVFAEDPWVQEAVWLLPDLMTMIAVMNSTLLPTFDNIDGYVELLMRQAYLAAWDTYHDAFDGDQKDEVYSAIPSVSRQLADVSLARVFSWLAICAFMTLSGALLLVAVLGSDDLKPPLETLQDARAARREEEVTGFGDITWGLVA